jgi:murein DD-endopeptidase MepM/ murein hydrolase activator NlpD
MVSKMQSLTTGVDKLQKSADSLLKTLTKINDVSASAITRTNGAINAVGGQMGNGQGPQVTLGTDNARFPDTTSRASQAMMGASFGGGGGGGGNSMSTSLGTFGFGQTVGQFRAQTAVNIATGTANAAFAFLPDVGSTMNNAAMYYQAGLKSPGINRASLERATRGAMRGGFSSAAGGGITANILASAGYAPGSANYTMAAAEVGGAYKYLGMDNAVAAQAISGMQTGSMGANLYQYGMTTYDPKTGKNKSMGQMATELMGLMGASGASVKQVQESYQRGALGANLRTMGFSSEQQEMLYQAMIDKASGRNPDLRNAKAVGGNENTMLEAAGRINASQAELMAKATERMTVGFENAADAVEAFTRGLGGTLAGSPLAQMQGFFGGLGGTSLGNGGKGIIDVLKQVTSLVLTRGKGKGGGTTGFGAAFGKGGAAGGMAPVQGGINAAYNAKDAEMWGSTNGNHTGMDYNVPVGTPVKAAMDGIVSQVDINADYGTSIMIDHSNGMQSIYAHLSGKNVKVGDQVKRGQNIGKSGESGNASGPHLHFEVRNGKNNPVDPSALIGSGGSILDPAYSTIIPKYSDVLGKSLTSGSGSSSAGTAYVGSGNYSKNALDDSTLRNTLMRAGFSGQGLENAMKIARAESGGRPGALNPNASTGDYSLGLFQINMIGNLGKRRNEKYLEQYGKYGYTGPESLYDPDINARIAFDISKSGTKWTDAWVNSSKKVGIGGASSGYGGSGLSGSAPNMVSGDRTVNITLKIDKASEDEAMRFARKVKSYLENDLELNRMGVS